MITGAKVPWYLYVHQTPLGVDYATYPIYIIDSADNTDYNDNIDYRAKWA